MTNPLTTDGFRNVALMLARITLGVYFLLAGFGKFSGGVVKFVDAREKAIPSFLPRDLGRAYLYMLPTAELIVGVALVIGFFTRTAATLMALMLVSFVIAVTGIGGNTGSGWNIDKNLVFLGMAILLMSSGGGQFAVDQSLGGGAPAPGPKKK